MILVHLSLYERKDNGIANRIKDIPITFCRCRYPNRLALNRLGGGDHIDFVEDFTNEGFKEIADFPESVYFLSL
jgi:hypothetical protein